MTTRYRADVVRYLTDRPGQVVYRNDLAADVGVTEQQVQSCIYNVIRNSPIGDEIKVVVGGNAWRYVPKPTTATLTSPEPTRPASNGVVRPAPSGVVNVTVPTTVAARRASTPVNRIFEEIGESQDGTIIIQESETGALYRATQI